MKTTKITLEQGATDQPLVGTDGIAHVLNYVYDPNTLTNVVQEASAGGSGGGGDASAANQVITNTKLDNLLTELQAKADLVDTQPVSLASAPLPTGAATSTKQDTGNTSVASIDTKTPALGQALMAASTPVVIASNQSAVPVSGTFYQATQPVSIASMPSTPVTGTFWQATQPVSGTFFQATQPVSIASMPSTPVTGTFWQATQPVSGTVTANATLAAETTKVIGTVNLSAAQTLATVTTVGAVTAITNALPAGTNLLGSHINATATKATFSATTAAFTPPATPTDMFIINGSATKTIKVLRVSIAPLQTTAGVNTFLLIKRSAANTAGTAIATTRAPRDSTNATVSAVVQHYTANPSALGASVGTIRTDRVLTPAAASTFIGGQIWDFTTDGTYQPIVLRGTAEGLAVNFNGVALPAGLSMVCSVDWTEE